jgi:hypothetical protein
MRRRAGQMQLWEELRGYRPSRMGIEAGGQIGRMR